MNRPEKKNAADPTMWRELTSVFTEVSRTAADRVLVLTGAGGDFCSGADLEGVDGDPVAYMNNASGAARSLHALSIPTIAKVDGVAVGAGWNLALGCDLVIATDRARFSQIFVRRALSVDMGGTWLLPRLVGLHRAKELAFLGDILSAARAQELGLVTRTVDAGDLDATVDAIATRLNHGPSHALSLTKQLLNAAAEGGSMEQALLRENHAQVDNMSGVGGIEAKDAFLTKRQPVFYRGDSVVPANT